MRNLMILAGGQGTRLGPLTATHSKALVSVQQRPMLVHHITAFPEAEHIVIVTNEATHRQVSELVKLAFCHGNKGVNIKVVSQLAAAGPVDAIGVGLEFCEEGSVTVVFADTFLEDWDEFPAISDQVACTPGPGGRSFCWYDFAGSEWKDTVAGRGAGVFIGLLNADDVDELRSVTHQTLRETGRDVVEVPMSELLNRWQPPIHWVKGWHDTGDVKALQGTRRELFISRDKHKLELDSRGIITKVGASTAEKNFYNMLPYPAMTLFPSVYSTVDELKLEFVDLPSLAELWLYQPGTVGMWKDLVRDLLQTVCEDLWDHSTDGVHASETRAYRMYWEKPCERLAQAGESMSLLDPLIPRLKKLCQSSCNRVATIHGDLNFNNVLVSLPNGFFKLLDPRGEWGDSTGRGDFLYDIAKLRYSWHGFSAITHGLTPGHRLETCAALDEVLCEFVGYDCFKDLAVIEATLFLSALPLHPFEERPLLLRQAKLSIEEATS